MHSANIGFAVVATCNTSLVRDDNECVPVFMKAQQPLDNSVQEDDLAWVTQVTAVGDEGVVTIEEYRRVHGRAEDIDLGSWRVVFPVQGPFPAIFFVEIIMPSPPQVTPAMGILAGGGPAPGINAVLAAATIRARLEGVRVVGFIDGFSRLMSSRPDAGIDLDIQDVSRIHVRGGSMLGIARANPTKSQADLDRVLQGLREHNVSSLVTIGGDDTAFSAFQLAKRAGGDLAVAHVPKTIDNDLDLPPEIDTFGYQTARAVGVDIVRNLMVDAKTTGRWYFVVAMGRKAGHLALGIGKAAGATLTIVPEEFKGEKVPLSKVVQILAGAILKRMSDGRHDGVAVIAEGVALAIRDEDLAEIGSVEHDEHGHPRLADIDIGLLLKQKVHEELASLGVKAMIYEKNIGYELRCADPVPADMEYCRDLGYCAAKYLLEGGGGMMVSMQGGRFVPIPLAEMLDESTGRMQVRMVDVNSTRYAIARRYMIRLRRDDFEAPEVLAALSASCGLSPGEFTSRFEALVQDESPPLVLTP